MSNLPVMRAKLLSVMFYDRSYGHCWLRLCSTSSGAQGGDNIPNEIRTPKLADAERKQTSDELI